MKSPRRAAAASILSVVCCLSMSSCMTQMAINAAQGNPSGAPSNSPNYGNAPAIPAYYALVPLTIPLDLVTLPIQFVTANSQGVPFTPTPVVGPPPPPPNSQPPQQ